MRPDEEAPQFEKIRRLPQRRLYDKEHNREFMARSCRQKRRFKDTKAAQRFIRALQRILQDRFEAQRIYPCPFCNGFHTSGDPDLFEKHTHASE